MLEFKKNYAYFDLKAKLWGQLSWNSLRSSPALAKADVRRTTYDVRRTSALASAGLERRLSWKGLLVCQECVFRKRYQHLLKQINVIWFVLFSWFTSASSWPLSTHSLTQCFISWALTALFRAAFWAPNLLKVQMTSKFLSVSYLKVL